MSIYRLSRTAAAATSMASSYAGRRRCSEKVTVVSSTCLLLLLVVMTLCCGTASGSCSNYTRLFSFGDSISDTGNSLKILGIFSPLTTIARRPYGQTYFHRPTGRYCDGRVIVDFIADALGLPFLKAYKESGGPKEFEKGANFAVGGATAMSPFFFLARGMAVDPAGRPMNTQIGWFNDLLDSICQLDDCSDVLEKAMIMFGEIGGNDYNIPLITGRSLDEMFTFVPRVISTLVSGITKILRRGAKTVVVPGLFPIGCTPEFLTKFPSNNSQDYEPDTGCHKRLNELALYHNEQLQRELDGLRSVHVDATILYADYYGAAMDLFLNPAQYGFKESLRACCGADGPYNMRSLRPCGTSGYKIYGDPSTFVSWDGIHFTDAANQILAHKVLSHYTFPVPIASLCPGML